ncbi:MAG: CPBP family intramembrane metalloprotease [Bacteroidales bacterium]|jgi:hypothetical protein|nr:CPBP family intramembrane metalloprotease [Bacteroidales bacterium]
MNHLESSFTGKNSLWRYFIMIVTVFTASNTIGALPLLITIGSRTVSDPGMLEKMSANPADLSPLGIDPNLSLLMMLFPFLVSLAVFVILIKPLNGRTLMQIVNGTGNFRCKRFFISSLVWLIVSAIYLVVSLKIDPSNFSLNNISGTLILLVIISVLLIPFQTAFEEIIFRGYMMQGFAVLAKNRWIPLVMTSLLFALIHGLNPEVKEFGFFTMMPQYLLFGLIFGIITILDDGIEAAMGAHAANNAFLCIMITNKNSALQTQAIFEQHTIHPWSEFVSMLFMGILVIGILKMVFKWNRFSALFEKIAPQPGDIQMP